MKISQEFIKRSEHLQEFPKLGRIIPEIDDANIRELIIYSYRLIYEVSHSKIEILAIIHNKQDFSKNFDKPKK